MTFLSPALLWTLAALAPLAAIYFLKVRPRKKPVTAFFLWQQIFTEKRSSALFKRLRDLWSLLLMALAFAVIALALAEPDLEGDERKDLLVIVDNSASMTAKDGASTRLQTAKDKARGLITALNGSQRAAVATLSDRLTMLAQPTRHRRSLLEAVDGIQPTPLPSRSMALPDVQSGQDGLKNTRVLFITDGCVDDPAKLAATEILKVGTGDTGNLGIVRADLRPLPGEGFRLGLFTVMQSTHKEPVSADLMLRHEDSGQLVKVIPQHVQPGLNPSSTLILEDAQPGKWSLTLDRPDGLDLDNRVWLQVPPRIPLPVAVLADNAFFLENVVRAFERSEQNLQLETDAAKARLSLTLSRSPASGSAVVFHPQGESPLWSDLGGEIVTPVPKVKIKDHALLRYLDAENMLFTGARQLKAPAGAVVLVADESGTPLIYLIRQGEASLCVVNLDPLAAQFYLSAWFPVMIHNAAAHLGGRDTPFPATLATGTSTVLPGLAEDGETKITSPAGTTNTLALPASLHLEETGFYQASNKDSSSTLAVSLVSPVESGAAAARLQDTTRPLARGQAPSYWLLVLGLVALATESALYHRRKVG